MRCFPVWEVPRSGNGGVFQVAEPPVSQPQCGECTPSAFGSSPEGGAKFSLPPPGEVPRSGNGGVFLWQSHWGFATSWLNAPPQSPLATASLRGEPRVRSPLRGECTPSVASGDSSPGGGAEILKPPPRRGSRDSKAATPEGEPRVHSPLRGKCTPSAFGSSPEGGAEGFYYQNRYLMPALAFHCIS